MPLVLMLLPHCHRDQSLAITHWQENKIPFIVRCHESGAIAFKNADTGQHRDGLKNIKPENKSSLKI